MEFGFPKTLAYSLDLTAFNGETHNFNQGNCYIQLALEMQISARMGYFGKDIDFLEVGAKPDKFGSHLLHIEGKKHALNLDENVCSFSDNEISNIICTTYFLSIFKGNCPTRPH